MRLPRAAKLPRTGRPGTLPRVGVTGDLYTRINPLGNGDLFRRLEQMGCEVWSSPFFAGMADLATALKIPRRTECGRLGDAVIEGLQRALTSTVRHRLIKSLPPEVISIAVEPPVEELIPLAQPYIGLRTNSLILLSAAKIVDFLRRGARGVIHAAGLNCMVGTATASVIPARRSDFGEVPVLNLIYGGAEGPAQRIRLETFVHQLHDNRGHFAA